jgi:hypothetical protein
VVSPRDLLPVFLRPEEDIGTEIIEDVPAEIDTPSSRRAG